MNTNKYLPVPVKEMQIFDINPVAYVNNIFHLISSLTQGIEETTEARRKVIRELIDETMTSQINIFEKLSLHFSKEAMLMEKNRDNLLELFDMLTFHKKRELR